MEELYCKFDLNKGLTCDNRDSDFKTDFLEMVLDAFK